MYSDQLDENLQDVFITYLTERGFTPELASFIPAYIEHKEQKEYVNWLANVKAFVSKQ